MDGCVHLHFLSSRSCDVILTYVIQMFVKMGATWLAFLMFPRADRRTSLYSTTTENEKSSEFDKCSID